MTTVTINASHLEEIGEVLRSGSPAFILAAVTTENGTNGYSGGMGGGTDDLAELLADLVIGFTAKEENSELLRKALLRAKIRSAAREQQAELNRIDSGLQK